DGPDLKYSSPVGSTGGVLRPAPQVNRPCWPVPSVLPRPHFSICPTSLHWRGYPPSSACSSQRIISCAHCCPPARHFGPFRHTADSSYEQKH
ncbi:unnamed protein product, partial [Ectocarpus sp. 13 AM-2016]